MFMRVVEVDGAAAGSAGFWPARHDDEDVYEAGWHILPAFQGRGLAAAAALMLVEQARDRGDRTALHAYPYVANVASNRTCRRAGFVLVGERDHEFPPGQWMRVNDWRLALGSPAG